MPDGNSQADRYQIVTVKISKTVKRQDLDKSLRPAAFGQLTHDDKDPQQLNDNQDSVQKPDETVSMEVVLGFG